MLSYATRTGKGGYDNMKRYLVCSDIHGRIDLFKKAFLKDKAVDGVLIAGDLQLDTYEITDFVYAKGNDCCNVYMVCGNCDAYEPSASLLPSVLFCEAGPHRILLTHGHRYYAPRTDLMSYKAEENGCDIVIFGHIHRFVFEKIDDILFLNPGALMSGSYAVLTVANDGTVSFEHMSV